MKTKHRNITVCDTDFRYWYSESYDGKYNLLTNRTIVSPKDNKNSRVIIEFYYERNSERFVESPFIDPSSLQMMYSKAGEKTERQKMPLIYYDVEHLFSASATKNGIEAIIDWGKPKAINEIIEYLLQSNQWDTSLKNSTTINGWSLLEQMGYSNMKSIISWSW